MQITIYASCLDDAKKTLDKIARKASGYGIPFSYTTGEPYPKKVTYWGKVEYHGNGQYSQKHSDTMVEAIDIDISCDSLIRAGNWTTVAMLEHFDNGNIVTRFIDRDDPIPDDWRHRKPVCDHCHISRSRNITYLVRDNASGELRQVGSSCLKDYTGIDPRATVAFAALYDDMSAYDFDRAEYDPDRERGHHIYATSHIIALAVEDIAARHGYRTTKQPDSTKDAVLRALREHHYPSDDAYKKAHDIIDWLKSDDTLYGLDLDCAILAKNEYCKLNHVGSLSYIPVSYDKMLEKRAKQMQDQESRHVGTVGQRINLTLTLDHSSYFETSYNGWDTVLVYIHSLKDADGNVYIWRSQKLPGIEVQDKRGFYRFDAVEDGESFDCKATIKAHSEYKGIKQTEITRLKTLAVYHAAKPAPEAPETHDADPVQNALDALDLLEA